MGGLTQVVLLGFCVFWGCDRSDELYPGAPIISLKKLQSNSETFRYMVVAKEPIPYDIVGSLEIRQEGVHMDAYALDIDGRKVREIYSEGFTAEYRDKYPATGSRMDESNYGGWFSIKKGLQSSTHQFDVHGSVGGGVLYRKKDGLGNYVYFFIYVNTRTDKLTIKLPPWNGTGNYPYNIGKSKITLKR